jgi:hypothetical protein
MVVTAIRVEAAVPGRGGVGINCRDARGQIKNPTILEQLR